MANFRKLSNKQVEVFEQIAIGNDAGHSQRTLDSLVRKGLIDKYQEGFTDNIGHGYIYRYRVLIPVHMEWCEWCAAQPSSTYA